MIRRFVSSPIVLLFASAVLVALAFLIREPRRLAVRRLA